MNRFLSYFLTFFFLVFSPFSLAHNDLPHYELESGEISFLMEFEPSGKPALGKISIISFEFSNASSKQPIIHLDGMVKIFKASDSSKAIYQNSLHAHAGKASVAYAVKEPGNYFVDVSIRPSSEPGATQFEPASAQFLVEVEENGGESNSSKQKESEGNASQGQNGQLFLFAGLLLFLAGALAFLKIKGRI